jgi:hypothetical protein
MYFDFSRFSFHVPISGWGGGHWQAVQVARLLKLDRLDTGVGVDRTIYVVNLFPNKAPIPRTLGGHRADANSTIREQGL